MLARRGVEHRAQFGMHRDRQRDAGLLLFHREHAVADVLAAHLDDIAAPLRRVEQQRQREARLAADRMMCLELRDLVVSPGVESVALDGRQLDVCGRVRAQPAVIDKRQRLLYEGKAVPLKEVQNSRATLDAAESDVRAAEVALEAARNRLRILGKTDQEITEFQQKGTIDPATLITAPIGGTIVQRKVGPGQYVGSGQTDPVFIIGDLSTVWVVAYMRETEAPMVQVGQAIYFTVLAYPDRWFPANISYVAAAFDPTTRRLLVRATVNNAAGLLKPEMFASVKSLSGEGDNAVAVPRDAIIYEGDSVRVWAVRDDDKAIELRRIKVGLTNGKVVEVVEGLAPKDLVVTKGSLFIDRVAAGG
jgi:membrane fusion protein, heavy metal efflux system